MKKKINSPIADSNSQSSLSSSSLPQDPNLSDILKHGSLGPVFKDCTFNVNVNGSNFSNITAENVTNASPTFSGDIDNSKTKITDKSVNQAIDFKITPEKESEKRWWALLIEHPIISSVIAGLILAAIMASQFWKDVEKDINTKTQSTTTQMK